MRNPATSPSIVAGLLAALLCVGPARAQFVSTAVTGLNSPAGVAIDSNANLYIADTDNNRIALFVPTSGKLTTFAGSGKVGTNNGAGTAASFDQPWGIIAVSNGLVVSDYGSGLIRFVTFGGTVSTLAGKPFAFLSGNGFANGPAATAAFSFPTGLAEDSVGNLYVADSQNNAIREISTNNMVSTVPVTNGYMFALPNAVAVDTNNNVWVADSGNNCICMISNGIVTVEAGMFGVAGTNDSLMATNAQFNSPSGLLWLPNDGALYISDTGNDTVRSLFTTNGTYAVETIGGLAGVKGFVSGDLSVAEFNQPTGLCFDPTDFGYYVADSANNAVRVLQATAPLPAVSAPIFGYVTFPPPSGTSVFVASSSSVFNNLTAIAIEAEQGTQTYITFGPTGSLIPQPGPGSDSPPIYPGDGSVPPISSAVEPGLGTNDITIYAIGVQSGRRSSPVVSARFQFVTANPSIEGNNAADVELTDITEGADLYYTINYGTNFASPTNDGSSLGPVTSGTTLSFDITNNVTLLVRAFASGLATSQIVGSELSFSNVLGNQMTWGFASGPASTHFITGLNLGFSAPVAYTQIPSSLAIYTFQFDVSVTTNGAEPVPAYGFVSDLVENFVPPQYTNIPPSIYVDGMTNSGILTNQPFTLEVAWLVTTPVTNLYPVTSLLAQSIAADTLFTLPQAVVGTFSFIIPSGASNSPTPYTIGISYPSASTYHNPDDTVEEQPIPVYVQAPTNGTLTGTGPNAIKLVTVLTNNSPASAHLVGDVEPFNWYNIGDFGDGLVLNNDVIQTLNYVGYSHFANTPYFDAMDSSNGSTNDYYTANDTFVDSIMTGDGIIDVDDVYVTLRRSLDSALTNYARYWSGSNWLPEVYSASVQEIRPISPLPLKLSLNAPRYISVGADQVQTGGGLTAQVPIRVLAADTLPVRVFMVNVVIEALDGSPIITNAVSFSAATNLGSPYATVSQSVNNYAAGWLDSTISGVSGANLIGTLTVTLPPNVTTNSAYLVHFNHFSASPNGLALFNVTIQDGLITVGNRTGSSWHDGIPDAWRLLYFGTVSNILSAANADPDGDGANNWDEYIAGTNPLDATSVFKFSASPLPVEGYFTLQWPSVVNKNYSVQRSPSPAGNWTTVAGNLLGNSQPLQWTDTNASTGARFYRALVQ